MLQPTRSDTYCAAPELGIYGQGGWAAVPGRSNHGWGMAVDVDMDDAGQAVPPEWFDRVGWGDEMLSVPGPVNFATPVFDGCREEELIELLQAGGSRPPQEPWASMANTGHW